MKKYFVLVLLILMAVVMHAQDGLSLQLGYASPTFRLNSPVLEDKTQLESMPMNGFRVALAYDASFWKGLGVMLGLDYTYAAHMGRWESQGAYEYPRVKSKSEINQLELFVDWQYKFEIAKGTYLILYSGPTIQCNLSMTQTDYLQTSVDDAGTKKVVGMLDISDETVSKAYKRINATWGVGAGFQYDRFFVRGGYDFGIINPYKFDNFNQVGYPDRNTRGRLDQWQVKIGAYLFAK